MQQNIKRVINKADFNEVNYNSNNFTTDSYNSFNDVEQIDFDKNINGQIEKANTNKEDFLNSVSYNLDVNKKISENFSKKVYNEFIEKMNNIDYDYGEKNARVK